MGRRTKIEWTDRTLNLWHGCSKISEGCKFCYAEAINKRFHGGANWGKDAPRKRASETARKLPLKWNREAERKGKRIRVFFGSMADWLDPQTPIELLVDLLQLIRQTPWLDWQLLTKRPELWDTRIYAAQCAMEALVPEEPIADAALMCRHWRLDRKPPANVWIGVSAENQHRLMERAAAANNIPALVHFVSGEPLLGPLDFSPAICRIFDWIILGGESGPNARPCDIQWINDILSHNGYAVFVKQLGRYPTVNGSLLSLKDAKGGDPDEWPERLRVREFPTVKSHRMKAP